MDPLKTAFIDAVPAGKDDAVAAALKPLGLAKWVPLEGGGSAYAQFSSAAQIKAAVEVLPLAGLRITTSEETGTWVSRAAAKATVQNVTRMSPAYLATKIKTALNKPSRARDGPGDALPAIVPDGTLEIKDARLWDEIRKFREQSRAPRKKKDAEPSPHPALDAKRARRASQHSEGATVTANSGPEKAVAGAVHSHAAAEPPSSRASTHTHTEESSASDPAHSASPPVLQKDRRSNEGALASPPAGSAGPRVSSEQAEALPDDKSLPPRASTSAAPSKDANADSNYEPHASSGARQQAAVRPPQPQEESASPDLAHSAERPAESASALLPGLVEEFFGVADDEVIATLQTHIRERRPAALLAAEFRDVLEEDFARFAEEVQKLVHT